MFFYFILFCFLILIAIYVLSNTIFIVKQNEAIIIERKGRYYSTLLTGKYFFIPFMYSVKSVPNIHRIVMASSEYKLSDYVQKVDLSEKLGMEKNLEVQTRDLVKLRIEILYSIQVFDPVKYAYLENDIYSYFYKLLEKDFNTFFLNISYNECRDIHSIDFSLLLQQLNISLEELGIKLNYFQIHNLERCACS